MTKIKQPSKDVLDYIKNNYSYDDGRVNGPQKDDVGELHKRSNGSVNCRIKIAGRNIRRSHLVWYLCKGYWNIMEIDHIDRDPMNDKIDNLREATDAEQQQNTSRYKGYKGFSVEERKDRERVAKYRVRNKSKNIELGNYSSVAEALAKIDEFWKLRGEEYLWVHWKGNSEK